MLRDLRQNRDGGRVVTRIPDDGPLIASDPVLLRHALINLVDNALKFSPETSVVEIVLECDSLHVTCRVLDRGPGLPAQHDGLFERFERLEGSDRVGGTGLGLWIAKNLVEAVGGVISASNRPEGGAEFAVRLPASNSRSEPADA